MAQQTKQGWLVLGLAVAVFGFGCEGAVEADYGDDVMEIDEELNAAQRAWSSGNFAGDLSIRASWAGNADLDLYVRTPTGQTMYYGNKSDGRGGLFTKNACRNCSGDLSEEVSWVEVAPTGEYQVWLERYDSRAVEDLVIEVWRGGALEETFAMADVGTSRGDQSEMISVDVQELPVESVFSGDLGIQLSWSGPADLDLVVLTPTGETLQYNRTSDSAGGRFSKNNCLLNLCRHGSSEETTWSSAAPMGTYRLGVVNYNGRAVADAKLRVHNRGQIIESHDLVVPASRRARVDAPDITFSSVPLNPEGVEIISHQNEQWLSGLSTQFDVRVNDSSVEQISLSVNGRAVATDDARDSASIEHRFAAAGQHSVEIAGINGDGMIIAAERLTLVVSGDDGDLPRQSDAHAVSKRLLAKRVDQLQGIQLFGELFDSRYLRDERNGRFADSASNILDAAKGGLSSTSCYGNAPCRSTSLGYDMLRAMVLINQKHGLDYQVSTITGGSHSRSSRHYEGVAVDINRLEGGRISTATRTLNRRFTDLCRAYGATEILQPPQAGHSTHIHCAWPRP